MRWLHCFVFYYLNFYEVESIFLSLLQELRMSNPVIVGKDSDLKTREMFQLMKNVMRLGQTITLTTSLTNESSDE